MREHHAEPAARQASRVGRITSLDWVRGWFLVGSVATVSVLPPRPDQLNHAPWFGLTVEDTIFPLFVTLSGCGLAFAYRNRVGWGATLRRSVVLLLCGLAYNMVAAGSLDLGSLRFTGPLQIYSVLVLVIGLLHLVARTAQGWALITTAVAVGQGAFLMVWQVGCPGNELSRECNPSAAIDTAILGSAHMYASGAAGHDPEGFVAILGALLTACVGTTAGHIALSARGTRQAPLFLVGWAAVVATAAVTAVQLLPVMKRLWTTPFALGVAAAGVVLLAAGMALLDLPARGRWTQVRERLAWPQIAMGRNSLLVYFGSHLLVIVLLARGGEPSWAQEVALAVDVVGHPRASFVVAMLVAWGGLAALLHRRGIYLRP
jgi:predicted acyltransferase